jgi:hypothetical protein
MEYWVDGFKRDSYPSKEIGYWEHIAAVYREYSAMSTPLTLEQHERVFRVILMSTNTGDEHALKKEAEGLPSGALERILNLLAHAEPVYDIKEQLPFTNRANPSDDELKRLRNLDKERLPNDLPEELIRKLMGTRK